MEANETSERGGSMEKNYEVLKHYLQSEKQAGNMKKRHSVPQMHRDEDQIVISYPNEEVCNCLLYTSESYKDQKRCFV